MVTNRLFAREVVKWHREDPESRPWLKILFPGLEILLLDSEATGCWLTRSPNARPVPIVPYKLGGTREPKNHVILNRGLVHKAPEEATPEAFLEWLTEKAKRRRERYAQTFKKVFGDDPKAVRKLIRLGDWMEENGVKLPKIELPKGIPPGGLEAEMLQMKHLLEEGQN
jgi:hypothetical protein